METPATNWKQIAEEAIVALRLMNAHHDDLSKSNPGFMGKMCLQDYGLWNRALMKSEQFVCDHKSVIDLVMEKHGGA